MTQNHDSKKFHGDSMPIQVLAGLWIVALCCANVALAEDSQDHHGAAVVEHHAPNSAFSYNFVELRYIDTTIDEAGGDLDGTGVEIEGSVAVGDRFQAFALYEDIGFDHEIDLSEWAIGFGTHFAVAASADFVAEVGYVSEEISEPGHATHSDEGYLMGVGFRQKIGERGEIQLGVSFVDFSEAGSRTTYELVGEMHVLPTVAVGVGIDISADATSYFAEARVYFGGH